MELRTKIIQLLADKLNVDESEVPSNLIERAIAKYTANSQAASADSKSIFQKFEDACENFSIAEAINYSGKSRTFSMMKENVEYVARKIGQSKINSSDKLAVISKKPDEVIVAILACLKIGVDVCYIDGFSGIEYTKARLEDQGISFVLCDEDLISFYERSDVAIMPVKWQENVAFEPQSFNKISNNSKISICVIDNYLDFSQNEVLDIVNGWSGISNFHDQSVISLCFSSLTVQWLQLALAGILSGKSVKVSLVSSSINSTDFLTDSSFVFLESEIFSLILHRSLRLPDSLKTIVFGSEPLDCHDKVISLIPSDCRSVYINAPSGCPPLYESSFPLKSSSVIGSSSLGKMEVFDHLGFSAIPNQVGVLHCWNGKKIVSTGIYARKDEDGLIHLVEQKQHKARIINSSILSLERIQEAFFRMNFVRDSVAAFRKNYMGLWDVVVYVVINDDRLSSKDIRSKLTVDNSLSLSNVEIVLVTSIPYKKGQVDFSELEVIPHLSEREVSIVRDHLYTHENYLVFIGPNAPRQQGSSVNRFELLSAFINKSSSEPLTANVNVSVVNKACQSSSYLSGGDFYLESDKETDLCSALIRTAEQYPEKGIVFVSKSTQRKMTYKELLKNALLVLGGLQKTGLQVGSPVILQFDEDASFLEAFWACLLGGYVPTTVAVSPSYDHMNSITNKFMSTWQLLKMPYVISTHSLTHELKSLSTLYLSEGLQVLEIESLRSDNRIGKLVTRQSDDVAFYQLTSGSTGTPKCIPETHGRVIQHIQSTTSHNRLSKDDITLNWLRFDHVVPLLTFHIKDVYLGANQIHTTTNDIIESPLRWLELIEQYNVTHTWSPNFGFKLLVDSVRKDTDLKFDLSSVKSFMNAGEQITLNVVQEFSQLMNGFGMREQALQPAFGMAELGTCITYSSGIVSNSNRIKRPDLASLGSNEIETYFVSSGKPTPGVEVRIADENNCVLNCDEIGRLQVRSDVVMPGYLDNQEANNDSFTKDGWFQTGDLAYISDNNVYIVGREKEQIIIRGVHYSCYEIESKVSELPGVLPTYVAAVGIQDSQTGSEHLVVFFVSESNESSLDISKSIRVMISNEFLVSPTYIVPMKRDQFGKTTSGKVQRNQLKHQFINDEFELVVDYQKENQLNTEELKPVYEKTWVHKNIVNIRKFQRQKAIMIITANSGSYKDIRMQCLDNGLRSISVFAANEFNKIGDYEFSLKIDDLAHYCELQRSLNITELDLVIAPDVIKSNSETIDQSSIIIDVINAVQASFSINRFLVLARNIWSSNENEYSNPEIAAISGLLKSLTIEVEGCQSKLIDIGIASDEEIGGLVVDELHSLDSDDEIIYRGKNRLVSKLSQISFNSITESIDLSGKLFVVTGASGGIASCLSKYLLKKFNARLLLLSRSAIDFQSRKWKDVSAYHDRVTFKEVDITDHDSVRNSIIEAEVTHQAKVSGVFHFAGILDYSSIAEESLSSFEQKIAPKVHGSKNILEIFSENSDVFIVVASSVNGEFGGNLASAYSVANCYVSELPNSKMATKNKLVSLAWTQWDGIGMSQNHSAKILAESKGFSSLSVEEGLDSILLAIAYNKSASLFVGLDNRFRNVSSRILSKPVSAESIYVVCDKFNSLSDKLKSQEKLNLLDSYGAKINYGVTIVDSIPKSESEQRDLIRQAMSLHNTSESKGVFEAPKTSIEKQTAIIWSTLLSTANVSLNDDFFELGGHSLSAVQLVSRLRKEFGVEVTISDLFNNSKLSDLTTLISNNLGSYESTLELKRLTQKPKEIPLSYAQERLWFINMLDPGNPVYNIHQVFAITGSFDINRAKQAFGDIISRHEILRTSYKIGEHGSAIQKVGFDVASNYIDFSYADLTDLENPEFEFDNIVLENSKKGFDLSSTPIMRVSIARIESNRYKLFFCIHHIAADGWSIPILIREFFSFYSGLKLKSLPIDYSDYAIWQRAWFEGELYDKQLQFWKGKLDGYSGNLNLYTDFKRPNIPSLKGNSLPLKLNGDVFLELKELAKSLNSTTYMVLLTLFSVLIRRYSIGDDVVIGTPIAGRRRQETEDLIGFFVNTLPIRSNVNFDKSLINLVTETRNEFISAQDNQDFPFERLVTELTSHRNIDRQPLVQVMFVYQNNQNIQLGTNELTVVPEHTPYLYSKYDLSFNLVETGNGLEGIIEYSTDLYSSVTIEKIKGEWEVLTTKFVREPNLNVNELLATLPKLGYMYSDEIKKKGTNDSGRLNSQIYSPPQSEMEKLIAGVWSIVLNVELVGIDDNFFELGGHSLLMVDLQDRLNRELHAFRTQIDIVELFQFPTIRGLAKDLDSKTQRVSQAISSATERADKRRGRLGTRRNSINKS